MAPETTTELRERLRRLRSVHKTAKGPKAELERGIREAEAELARRERILARREAVQVEREDRRGDFA